MPALQISKNEFKRYLKLAIVWTVGFGLFSILIFSLFDGIANGAQSGLQELIKSYPESLRKAFSFTTASFTNPEAFFTTEIMKTSVIMTIFLGVFLGAKSIGGEINTRTISFLVSRPISRVRIYTAKVAALAAILAGSDLVIALLTFVASQTLTQDHSASLLFFLLTFGVFYCLQMVLLGVGVALGSVWGDGQAMLIGMGAGFALYMLDVFSNLDGMPSFVKYLTPFHYANLDYVLQNHAVDVANLAVLVVLAILLLTFGGWWFWRRNLDI